MVQLLVTAQSKITHDGVKSVSRQSDFIMGGELTASDFFLDVVTLGNLYIVLKFSFISVQL
jgi:hypothetical protein